MSMVIKTNMDSVRTLNQVTSNHTAAQKYLQKITTGMKLNSAQDDASAYSISERMRVRIRALEQGNANTQNGSNMMKTAEGAVSNILDALRTLKERAINAANDSNSDEDRRMMQKEFDQLVDQIDEDALITFNNKYLIDGTRNNAFMPAKTIFLNRSLAEDTTLTTALTELKNRAGDSLGIQSTDCFQLSWVMNGNLNTASGQVGTTNLTQLFEEMTDELKGNAADLQATTAGQITGITDKFGRDVYTPDKSQGIVVSSKVAGEAAIQDQIVGLAISITDASGNVKKSANAALDQFKQYQRAETKTGDQALSFQVGADSNFATKFGISDMRALALGLKGKDNNVISISTKEAANATINVLDNVISKVLDQQTMIGAALARLEHTSTNLTTAFTNDQASESVIRDADMATEVAGYIKYSILMQSSEAMLTQANQNPNNVLALLGGGESE